MGRRRTRGRRSIAVAAAVTAIALALAGFVASPQEGVPPSETASAEGFVCTATKVHDGDGPIWCAERDAAGKPIKIRLQAIAARELDESCSDGHPCPAASGAEAQQALEKLALGRRLRCEATGTSYSRVTAWCWREDGVELNCAMVKSGTALRWDKYDRQRRLCS